VKYSTLASYQQALKECASEQLPVVVLVLAKDAYDRKQAVDTYLRLSESWDIKSFEGESLERSYLFDELNTVPFLGQGTCVSLVHLDKVDKATLTSLVDYVSAPNPAVRLIMSGSSLPGRHRLLKACEEHGFFCSIAELRPWEKEQQIEAWIRTYIQEAGKSVEAAGSSMLARQLGTDKILLQGEMNKLLCYVGDRKKVTAEDVMQICACVNLDTIWQLGEAILRREVGKALSVTRKLVTDGMNVLTLLWQVRSQLQTAFQICSIIDKGGAAGQVMQQFPYMKGRILERNMQLAQDYGRVRFRRALLLVNKADMQLKNSVGPSDVLVEHLVAQLCH